MKQSLHRQSRISAPPQWHRESLALFVALFMFGASAALGQQREAPAPSLVPALSLLQNMERELMSATDPLHNQNPMAGDFCSNAHDALCATPGSIQNHVERRRHAIEVFKQEILTETARSYLSHHIQGSRQRLRRLREMNGQQLLAVAHDLTGLRARERDAKEFGTLRDSIEQSRLLPWHQQAAAIIDAVKLEFEMVLNHDLRDLPSAQNLWLRVRSIRLQTLPEALNNFSTRPDLAMGLTRVYLMNCGRDGMEEQAFVLPGIEGVMDPFMILCPGILVANRALGPQAHTTLFLSIFQAIAHELSHAIDSRSCGFLFNQYGQCLAERHLDELRRSLPPEAPATMPVSEIVARHLPEISADAWAARVVGRFLSDLDGHMGRLSFSQAQRHHVLERALRGIYGVYCEDAPNDGMHATGRLRIRDILGGNSQIRQLMGCQPPSIQNNNCTF